MSIQQTPALFRQEALDHYNQHRQWGNVAALEPLRLKVTVWFILLIVAGLVAFLFAGEYARKEAAVGYLTPASGTSKIFAPRPGHIRQVHVKEGELVREGQALLTIDTDQFASDGLDVNATLLESLNDQKNRLQSNIKSEEARSVSERERLTALAKGLEAEMAQLDSQSALHAERLQVLESELQAGNGLREKGFITAQDFRRRQLLVLEQKQAISATDQHISAKRNQLIESQFNLRQSPTLMAHRIQELRNELASAEQKLTEVKGRQSLVIRSPVAGRVTTLQARSGQMVDPQRLQLEIIPEGSELRAELYVPARAIGFVEVGQAVRLLYDAFPYQHFGSYPGRVIEVSQTILTSADSGGPIRLTEPAYKVIATVDKSYIDAFDKKVPLQPDMLLRADIILERRTLISWLTNPIRSVRM
jgi:membrane fusion protein